MKWNGYFGLALAAILVVVASQAAQAQVNRYADEGVIVDQSPAIRPVAYSSFGGGHGWTQDLSGWNQCECPAPCTAHLWQGYVQTPHRCFPGHHGGGHCGNCNAGHCNNCGNGGACAACGNGYGAYGGGGNNGYQQGPGAAVNVYAQTYLNANNGYCNSCNKAEYYDRIFGNSNPFAYTPTPAATGAIRPAIQATPVAASAQQNVVAPINLPTLQSANSAIGSGLK